MNIRICEHNKQVSAHILVSLYLSHKKTKLIFLRSQTHKNVVNGPGLKDMKKLVGNIHLWCRMKPGIVF